MKKMLIPVLFLCLVAFVVSCKLTLWSLSKEGNPCCTARTYGAPLPIIDAPCLCDKYDDPATGRRTTAPRLLIGGLVGNLIFYFVITIPPLFLALGYVLLFCDKSKHHGKESDSLDSGDLRRAVPYLKWLLVIIALMAFGYVAETMLLKPVRTINTKLLFFAAIENRNNQGAFELLEEGVDVKAKDYWGNTTALHLVKDADLAAELTKRGADVNARDSRGNTPLDFANTEEIKQLLRMHGAKTGKELQEEDK